MNAESVSRTIVQMLSGTVGVVIAFFVLLFCLYWMFFPFVVVSAIKQLRREMEAMHATLRTQMQVDVKANQALGKAVERLGNIDVGTEHTHAMLKWLGEQQQQQAIASPPAPPDTYPSST